MNSGSVLGTGSQKEFESWIEKCRIKSLSKRGATAATGDNFSNSSSSAYIDARERITNTIQSNRTISIELLYDKIDIDLLKNSNAKKIILDICREGDCFISSMTDTTSGKESGFSLTFVKRKPIKKPVNKPKMKVEHYNSNIEDVMDNSFYATGRKLDFDYKEKVSDKRPNISLQDKKKESNKQPVTTNKPSIKSFLSNMEKVKPKKTINPITSPEKIRNTPNIPELQSSEIFKKSVEKIEVPELITIEKVAVAEMKLEPVEKMKKWKNTSIDVFENLSEYELWYLIFYFNYYIKNNKKISDHYKSVRKIAIQYAKAKSSISGVRKGICGILSLTIILLPIGLLIIKNGTKKSAKLTFEERQVQLKDIVLQKEISSQFKEVFNYYNLLK